MTSFSSKREARFHYISTTSICESSTRRLRQTVLDFQLAIEENAADNKAFAAGSSSIPVQRFPRTLYYPVIREGGA